MSILSKLFREATQSDRSYVRTWAKKRLRALRYSNDLSPENIFTGMMLFLLPFGENDLECIIPPECKGLGFDNSEHYSGDATLFELGCYMYFQLDLWLCQNRPNHQKEISTIFANGFIELFTRSLKSGDIPALFEQRISQYEELARTGESGKTYHFRLEQLILRTRDNKLPESYDFEHAPVVVIDAFEHMGLKLALAAWEEGMIPGLLKSVESICNLTA